MKYMYEIYHFNSIKKFKETFKNFDVYLLNINKKKEFGIIVKIPQHSALQTSFYNSEKKHFLDDKKDKDLIYFPYSMLCEIAVIQ